MKKLAAIVLSIVMLASFSGCAATGFLVGSSITGLSGGSSKTPKTIDIDSSTPDGERSTVNIVF